MVQADADLEMANNSGETPLYLACTQSKHDVVKYLCEARANLHHVVSKTGSTPLYAAAQGGSEELLRTLLEWRACVHSRVGGYLPLHVACQVGHARAVELLCQAKSELTEVPEGSSVWTPLNLASERGHAEVVDTLCRANANVDEETVDTPPVLVAAWAGHEEVMQMLRSHGANLEVNSKKTGLTPLHAAAQAGNTGVVRCLCEAGVDADRENTTGQTPLLTALVNGHLAVMGSLVRSRFSG